MSNQKGENKLILSHTVARTKVNKEIEILRKHIQLHAYDKTLINKMTNKAEGFIE